MAGSNSINMGFDTLDSPLGTLSLYSEGDFVTRITFEDVETQATPTPILTLAKAQLEAYISGTLDVFDLPLKPAGTEFQQTVWQRLVEIPFGSTISYSKLATDLGDVKKIRAVGLANGKNPIAIVIPCHRVIGSSGDLVGYAGGLDKKEWLLRHEGADIYKQQELF